jgi:hypothetical protein
MNKKWILLIVLFFSLAGFSQKKTLTEKDYARKPYWIDMMDIEAVNFNETLKAYDIYWEHHNLPEEEGDRYIGKGQKNSKKISKKELKERREEAAMQFQVKKFNHWKIKHEPFVKENGNIMTAAERIKFHNEHP